MGSLMRLTRESLASIGWDRMSTRLGVALLVVSAIFFAANFADKVWLSYQFAQAKRDTMAQIADTQRQIDQARHQLAYLHSRAYYVQAARAFGYVQPGDYQLQVMVQDTGPTAPAPPPTPPPVHPKRHQSWLSRFFQEVVPGL